MPTVSTGAPPFWFTPDKSGKAALGGTLTAYRADAIQELKPIYQDPGGTIEFPNPLTISTGGFFPTIYFMEDEAYYLVFEQANGEEIYTANNYTPNSGGGGGPVNEYIDTYNHVVNGQFDYPFEIPTPLTVGPTQIAAKWYFRKSNTNATDTIVVEQFTPGDNEPNNWEGTPVNYVTYQCTGTGGGGETYKDFYTDLCSVLGFAGDEISVAIAGFSPTTSSIQLIAFQNFGTGGSPSAEVPTILGTFALTASPAKYTATVNLPSISGKVLGTNNDNYLRLAIRMPLNAISEVTFTNVQFIHNNIVPEYDHQTHDYVSAEVNGSSANGHVLTQTATDAYIMAKPGDPGDILTVSYEVTEDTGIFTNWLKADGRALSRTDYPALNAIYSAASYPWGNGDGSTTFNIYDARGRTNVGSGTGTGLTARTVGQMFGEETHTQTEAELYPHAHAERAVNASGTPVSVKQGTFGGAVTNTIRADGLELSSVSDLNTASVGGGDPFNVIQPSSVVCVLVKVK